MGKKNELTPQKKLFADLYLTNFNGTQSYKKIYKCSLKSAEANASRLLKTNKMRTYLQMRLSTLRTDLKMDAESVLLECGRIALADPADGQNEDGTWMKLLDMPINLRRAIKSLRAVETMENYDDGTTEVSSRIIDIKFCSKESQIKNLMNYHKMFETGRDDTGEKDVVTKLIEELGQNGKGLDIKDAKV